ncbi:hypothetical protein QNI19_27125 [Cytophagaceae bacterium DM2B3-1]|uniref:Uncharacterized protein n=1 Tax=Xanthocytophaga flava TaxID=3048013 RepID=A0ABT7CSA8_9BACT|nr:hypothetical protein [Xanthocytophaga flavus]MDJ1496635.1 hypothetical protein [Xanthocytophaga flavus]
MKSNLQVRSKGTMLPDIHIWVSWVDLGKMWVGCNELIIRLGKMGRIFGR